MNINKVKKILMLSMFFLLSSEISVFAMDTTELKSLIDNNKIEEVVKYKEYYQLKVKNSDYYKEILEIPISDTKSIDLINESFNSNSLMINDEDKNILIENNKIDNSNDKNTNMDSKILPLNERLEKYKSNNEISLEDLTLEINEKKVKKIIKTEIETDNEEVDEEDIEYEYSVLLYDLDEELDIIGDMEIYEIPEDIEVEIIDYTSNNLLTIFLVLFIFLMASVVISF